MGRVMHDRFSVNADQTSCGPRGSEEVALAVIWPESAARIGARRLARAEQTGGRTARRRARTREY